MPSIAYLLFLLIMTIRDHIVQFQILNHKYLATDNIPSTLGSFHKCFDELSSI